MNDKVKILLVEENDRKGNSYREMLQRCDYSITGVAVTNEEVFLSINEIQPNLILMDVSADDKNEWIKTAHTIKKKYNISTIFIIPKAENELIQKDIIHEKFEHLIKPFALIDLERKIEILLNKIDKNKNKESVNWYKNILNTVSDAIIVVDEYESIQFLNNSAKNIIGYNNEELLCKNFNELFQIVPDTSSEGLLILSCEISKNKIPNDFSDKILITKSGESIYVEEKRSIIKDEESGKTYQVITITDISNRRQAKLHAISNKEFYLNILEKFPALIWRTNKNGDYNFFNSKWSEFTGKELSTQIFRGWYEGIHPDDKDNYIKLFEDSLKNCKKFETEIRLLKSDMNYKWFIIAGNPYYDFNGLFNGFIGICFDINNRKIMEEELIETRNYLDKSNNFKRTIIANISHEIRTPLNGILGLTELLLDSLIQKEEKEFLRMIQQSGFTLLDLLNNLLDFSRIEEGKEELNIAPFNLRKIVRDVIKPLEYQIKQRPLKLSVNIDSSIPGAIMGDGAKVKQIISNLFNNANKFTEKGEIKIEIVRENLLNDAIDNDYNMLLHFLVSDTGIGIEKDKLNIIFDSFSQVDSSSTRKYSGPGLGLSIVKRLVDFMNGKLWVESEINKGSKFHCIIEFNQQKFNSKKNNLNKEAVL